MKTSMSGMIVKVAGNVIGVVTQWRLSKKRYTKVYELKMKPEVYIYRDGSGGLSGK